MRQLLSGGARAKTAVPLAAQTAAMRIAAPGKPLATQAATSAGPRIKIISISAESIE
jgi:hypothetical protein